MITTLLMAFYQRRTPRARSVTPDAVLVHEARVREDREALLAHQAPR